MRWAGKVTGAAVAVIVVSLLAACVPPVGDREAAAAAAQPITLEWDAVADSAGYKVYMGESTQHYYKSINVSASTTCLIDSLKKGTMYYFAVSAYGADGTESALSTELAYKAWQ